MIMFWRTFRPVDTGFGMQQPDDASVIVFFLGQNTHLQGPPNEGRYVRFGHDEGHVIWRNGEKIR